MKWNTIFWAFFAIAGISLVWHSCISFTANAVMAFGILSLFGVFKLAEDKTSVNRDPFSARVRRDLLNRLK